MSDKRLFWLAHAEARRSVAQFAMSAPDGWKVTFEPPSRTLDQNAAQWPILDAFSKQLLWPVNGQMVKMSDEEWKEVLTAAFMGEKARLAMGLDGGVVMLGHRTSKFPKATFSEWLEFLHATEADRGVIVYKDQRTKEPA